MAELKGYGPTQRLIFDGDANNYNSWELKFFSYMRVKNQRDAVDPASRAVVSQDKKERAFAELVQFLDDRSLQLIRRDANEDGRTAIEILREHYAGTSECRILSLIMTLATMKMTSKEDVTDYVLRCESAANALDQAGEPVSDRILNALVLKGLPQSFKQFRVHIEQQKKVTPFIELKKGLRTFEENERAANSSSTSTQQNNNNHADESIMRMRYESRSDGSANRNTRNNVNNSNNNTRARCQRCSGFGHSERECATAKPANGKSRNQQQQQQQDGKKRWCDYCRSGTHNTRECWSKKRSEREREDKTWYSKEENYESDEYEHSFQMFMRATEEKQQTSKASKDDELRYVEFENMCEEWDINFENLVEEMKESTNIEESKQFKIQDQNKIKIDTSYEENKEMCEEWDMNFEELMREMRNESENMQINIHMKENKKHESPRKVQEKVYTLSNDENKENKDNKRVNKSKSILVESNKPHKICISEVDTVPRPKESLLVDSGATSHISNDQAMFTSFDDHFTPAKHTVELADGTKESFAENKGMIEITVQDEAGAKRKITLRDTLYCPSFPQKIFSVKSATKEDEGAKVILDSKGGSLISSNGTIFPIKSRHGLYILDTYEHVETAKSCKPSKIRSASLEEWHQILGHVNTTDIIKLEKVVDDMKITNKTQFDCNICPLSKQVVHRSKEPDERATSPLQFIHSDLAGPITPTAKDGFEYVMNFVDDYTGACFVYMLKEKSDATSALKKFLCDVAPYGKVDYVTSRFRSDNGGEYIAKQFETILINKGIRHEYSAPNSPHQNGTAERNWRSLFEVARGMLIGSNLPKWLWSYAIMAASHV